jgi:glycosyltransferase involved in cell wall biosynthesis
MALGSVACDKPVAVSIVTISKDDPAGLQATIESVLAQTFVDFELIVVRSGTSQSLVLPADSRILVIDEPARGISRAMNSGVASVGSVSEWGRCIHRCKGTGVLGRCS